MRRSGALRRTRPRGPRAGSGRRSAGCGAGQPGGDQRQGGLAVRQGAAERAARLFGAAAALRDQIGYAAFADPLERRQYRADREVVQTRLGPARWEAATAAGRALAPADAVTFALGAESSPPRSQHTEFGV